MSDDMLQGSHGAAAAGIPLKVTARMNDTALNHYTIL